MKKHISKTTCRCPLSFVTLTALSWLFFLNPILHAQAKSGDDSTKKQDNFGFDAVEQKSRPQVGVLIEYFKLDHHKANQLIRQYAPKASNAMELRHMLGEMIKKGEAELVTTGWTRSMSGHRTKTESVREDICPTDYDAPEIVGANVNTKKKSQPDQATTNQHTRELHNKALSMAQPQASQIYISAATPAAFKTRNIGFTLEIDPVISPKHNMITLSLAPEILSRLEDSHFTRPGFEHKAHGIDNISMPNFYLKKVALQINTIPGNYNLLTIHTPHNDTGKRIIVLLKADLLLAK